MYRKPKYRSMITPGKLIRPIVGGTSSSSSTKEETEAINAATTAEAAASTAADHIVDVRKLLLKSYNALQETYNMVIEKDSGANIVSAPLEEYKIQAQPMIVLYINAILFILLIIIYHHQARLLKESLIVPMKLLKMHMSLRQK